MAPSSSQTARHVRCRIMGRRQIAAVILSAGLLGVSPTPTPSALCQTLHGNAQPLLAALLKNDSLLETANLALATSDHLVLRNVTEDLTQNLNSIGRLLGRGFPQDPNSAANAKAQLMIARLQTVASAQNDALNVILGYVRTQNMSDAQTEFPRGRPANQVEVLPGDTVRGTGAEIEQPTDPTTPVLGGTDRAQPPATVLAAVRRRIGDLEDSAGIAIMSVAQVCNRP